MSEEEHIEKDASPLASDEPRGVRRVWRNLKGTRLVVMCAGWWYLFLTLNTDNSLSRLLSVDPDAFQIEASRVDYAIVIGGFLGALLLVVVLLWFGLGFRGAHQLLQAPQEPKLAGGRALGRFGQAKLIGLYVLACFAALVVGALLVQLLPSEYFDSLPYVLNDVQFESMRVCATVCVTDLCLMAFHKTVIATVLALVTSTKRFRAAPAWKWAVVAVLVLLFGGLINTSPLRGPILYCLLLYGISELVSAWYFLRSRNLVATVVVSWVAYELSAAALYLLAL